MSVIFEENKLPDPFAKTYKVADFPAAAYVTRELKLKFAELSSPNAVLDAKEFAVAAEWLRPEFDLREEAMHNALVEQLAEYFGQGWEVRTPPFGGRVKVKILLAHFKVKRMLTPKRRLPEIPMAIGPRSVNVGYMIYQYISLTKDRVRRQIYALPADGWKPEQVQAITREACVFYRDRFYVRPANGGDATAKRDGAREPAVAEAAKGDATDRASP